METNWKFGIVHSWLYKYSNLNPIFIIERSISMLSSNQNLIQQSIQLTQNQTNQLITTLINAQQSQNAQHNATANSFVNIRPPEPIQRASDARGKARQPNDLTVRLTRMLKIGFEKYKCI